MSPADIDDWFVPRIRKTAVWVCCDGSTSLHYLIGELNKVFQGDGAAIRQDVIDLVQQLGGHGLLEGVTERKTNGLSQS
jgi:hypothetical protein